MSQLYLGYLELVIVDNNDVPLLDADEIAELPPNFVYVRSKRMSVGALRNLGTKHATGEICITWDEDDWSSPFRVDAQVTRLVESRKKVTGWHSILYWDERTKECFRYIGAPPYAMGTSQCYWKSWWEQNPFQEGSGVEDLPFSQQAQRAGQLDSCDAEQLCVARIHSSNVCPKQSLGHHKQWPKVERDALPKEFFASIGEKQ
jgi:glycosyltransferase involved in cell wall biosynthesis